MENIKEVDGIAVVRWEPAISGIGKTMHKAEKLILADGRETFGCTYEGCTYTAEKFQSITAGHWATHDPRPPKAWMQLADMTVEDLLNTVVDFEQTIATLRNRALAAEAKAAERLDKIQSLEGKLARREARLAVAGASESAQVTDLNNKILDLYAKIHEVTVERNEARNQLESIQNAFSVLGLRAGIGE